MRRLRLGVFGMMLVIIVEGCGGGAAVETAMPSTPITTPPEIEQMKQEMAKMRQAQLEGTRHTTGNRRR